MAQTSGSARRDATVTQSLRDLASTPQSSRLHHPPRSSRTCHLLALVALAGAASAPPALAQTSTSPLAPPPNGIREGDVHWDALVNATVHVSPTQTLEHATVIIRDGRIVSVTPGRDTDGDGEPDAPPAPPGARSWDCAGLHIYAGFIDPYLEVDVAAPLPTSPGTHWNPLITPQRDALSGAGVPADVASSLRGLGFTAAAIAPRAGILRGTTAIVSLGATPDDPSEVRPPVYAGANSPDQMLAVGFDTIGFGGGTARAVTYPDSQLGTIALLRQSFIDSAWQRDARAAGRAIPENCLDLLTNSDQRLLFEVDSELEALRAGSLAEEFGRAGVLVGSGFEVRMLQPVIDMHWPLILPLNFPETPDVSSVGRIDGLSLTELMTWEQVPTGPRRFDAAGLQVSLTTAKIRRRDQFDDNLRIAIKNGLPEDRALAMLTTNPADLLGVSNILGTVEAGKVASLIVATGNIFNEDTKIQDIWVDGVRTELNAPPDPKLDGDWDLTVLHGPQPLTGLLTFESGRRVTSTLAGETVRGRNARLAGDQVSFLLDSTAPGEAGEIVVSAVLVGDDRMVGQAIMPSGHVSQFFATRQVADADPSGVWSLTLGQGGRTITYTIKDNRVVYEGDAARTNTVRDFKVDGNVLTFTVDTHPAPPTPPPDAPATAPAESPDAGADAPPGVAEPDTPEGGEPADQPNEPAQPQASTPQAPPTANTPPAQVGPTTTTTVRATIDADTISGTVTTQDGLEIPFTGTRTALPPDEPKPVIRPDVPEAIGAPFGPYSRTELPPEELLIIRHATIWTSADAGIIQDGSMMVSGGHILYVGDEAGLGDLLSRIRLSGPPREIDAAGRHITAGIIDCHSHTGLTDINEGGQSCTAEVRVSDAMDPTDINWYRQLAGGVTTVNQLHGSANAIGGQNQVSKPRWGSPLPSDFFFEGAPTGIKSALGENPKNGNSYGPGATAQYPQTRMGVEAVIRDRFTAARQYSDEMERFARAAGVPPRRDLELEALSQILSGDRLVHCHSYRADEILMLCNVARDFGFRIGTFQHALEVYKVAPEVREMAGGASAFSDWWAYKVEVQDAIPYAGAIMHDVGIVVSFNSDSDELARRLNVEAAKAVHYGGLDPAEALKFVTLNPAIQLGIADRVGSLESGKEADFVIWSGDPLSSMTRCEATYVDGRCYFSLEDDAALRARNQADRTRIIQRILAETRPAGSDSDSPGARPGRGPRPGLLELTNDNSHNALNDYYLDQIRQGMDPTTPVCGDCGMTLLELMNK